jgi:hypothetical protein
MYCYLHFCAELLGLRADNIQLMKMVATHRDGEDFGRQYLAPKLLLASDIRPHPNVVRIHAKEPCLENMPMYDL